VSPQDIMIARFFGKLAALTTVIAGIEVRLAQTA
jgi:hypothetical protein